LKLSEQKRTAGKRGKDTGVWEETRGRPEQTRNTKGQTGGTRLSGQKGNRGPHDYFRKKMAKSSLVSKLSAPGNLKVSGGERKKTLRRARAYKAGPDLA